VIRHPATKTFGKAQQAAWTSADLASRFPEFVFSPDDVLGKAYGILFRNLLADESFLRRNFGLWNEKLTGKIARENNFRMLFEIRRSVLRFLFESKFYASLNSEIFREFAASFTQSLGFELSESDVLFQLSEDFAAAKNLRALLFAFGLGEYLRARYDFDWWTKRAAFEELIDFWNTAERHKAEEMARMIGFEMSFDLLKEI
jgi:sulfur relay (sulfurtransferase) DsrC/TusE family protein